MSKKKTTKKATLTLVESKPVQRLYDIVITLKDGGHHVFEERSERVRKELLNQLGDTNIALVRLDGEILRRDSKTGGFIEGMNTFFFNKASISTLEIRFFAASFCKPEDNRFKEFSFWNNE